MRFLALLVVIFWLITIPFVGLHLNTGEGQHTGYITAVQKQGVFWKTWRAYVKTDTQSSQEDRYCVMDEDLIEQLQKAAEEKRLVTIKYHSFFLSGIKNCEAEGDIINSIK